jgi:hypothetical protein
MGRSRSRSAGRWQACDEESSLEERIVFLEVENETLKSENASLRRKLVEVLRSKGGGASSSKRELPRKASPARDVPDDLAHRRRAKPREDGEPDMAQRQRANPGQASEEGNPLVAASQRRAEKREASLKESGASDRDNERNAVMLANSFGEVYNQQIPSNIPMEQRGPLVNAKLDMFLTHFDDSCQIFDLKSGGRIIKDRKMFTMRYNCVFRESGTKLRCTTHKRFYYDAPSAPTFVLDFETHESLVTATPGTRPDGSLGVRDPRTENLIVLYEERKGKICSIWIAQDGDKISLDPTAGEQILLRNPLVKMFEEKIKELRSGAKAGERIFHNYHETESIG